MELLDLLTDIGSSVAVLAAIYFFLGFMKGERAERATLINNHLDHASEEHSKILAVLERIERALIERG